MKHIKTGNYLDEAAGHALLAPVPGKEQAVAEETKGEMEDELTPRMLIAVAVF